MARYRRRPSPMPRPVPQNTVEPKPSLKAEVSTMQDGTKLSVFDFPSIGALVDYAKEKELGPCTTKTKPDWGYQEYKTQQACYQALDKGEVLEQVKKVYFDAVSRMEPMIEQFSNDTGISARRKRVYSDTDGDLNVERYLDKKDDCWEKTVRGKRKRLVRLGISFVLHCGNGQKEFAQVAGVGAAAADILQRLGYAVEIKMCYISKNYDARKGWFSAQFTAKSSEEPLDLQVIMQVGNTGLLRDVGFKVYYHEFDSNDTSYGSPYLPSKEMLEACGIDYIVSQSWIDGNEVLSIQGMLTDITKGGGEAIE